MICAGAILHAIETTRQGGDAFISCDRRHDRPEGRPILLVVLAAALASVPITIDPIFSGLAWALIFGLAASTLFTVLVIPLVYWLLYRNMPGHGLPVEE